MSLTKAEKQANEIVQQLATAKYTDGGTNKLFTTLKLSDGSSAQIVVKFKVLNTRECGCETDGRLRNTCWVCFFRDNADIVAEHEHERSWQKITGVSETQVNCARVIRFLAKKDLGTDAAHIVKTRAGLLSLL